MSRGRILIAEDEATLAWVERFNLESEGYEVEVAPEGRAVMDALDAFRPHLLILDVMLPYVDGWSILASLEDLPSQRRPKVILLSAAAGVADRARAEGLGVDSILSKPFDMDELIERVGVLLGAESGNGGEPGGPGSRAETGAGRGARREATQGPRGRHGHRAPEP